MFETLRKVVLPECRDGVVDRRAQSLQLSSAGFLRSLAFFIFGQGSLSLAVPALPGTAGLASGSSAAALLGTPVQASAAQLAKKI